VTNDQKHEMMLILTFLKGHAVSTIEAQEGKAWGSMRKVYQIEIGVWEPAHNAASVLLCFY
jgi:hypothetical protein